ncbi:MAG TPA: hypothetical protein VG265_07295 [Gaiellaceae bacterium]|nr:hypothetical protein [Gaiellaceae bacterium]
MNALKAAGRFLRWFVWMKPLHDQGLRALYGSVLAISAGALPVGAFLLWYLSSHRWCLFLMVWALVCAFGLNSLQATELEDRPLRDLEPGDKLDDYDGAGLLTVVSVECDVRDGSTFVVEPLGDVLARRMWVDDGNGSTPLSVRDALIEAGWLPPNEGIPAWIADLVRWEAEKLEARLLEATEDQRHLADRLHVELLKRDDMSEKLAELRTVFPSLPRGRSPQSSSERP